MRCSGCGTRGTYTRLREPWVLFLTPDGHGFEQYCGPCQDERAAYLRATALLTTFRLLLADDRGLRSLYLEVSS